MSISLKKTVQSNSEVAYRALRTQLELTYNEIQRFMKRVKESSQDQVIDNKRKRDNQTSEERKKRDFNLSDLTEVTSLTKSRSSQGRTV